MYTTTGDKHKNANIMIQEGYVQPESLPQPVNFAPKSTVQCFQKYIDRYYVQNFCVTSAACFD